MGSVIALPATFILGLLPKSVPDFIYKCKWIISLIYIDVFNYLHSRRLDLGDSGDPDDPEKTGSIALREEFEMESPFPESHLLKAKDEIFFYGVNSKNERLVVSINRRCDQKADARVYLKLESGKTYDLVRTTDVEQVGVENHVFSCGHLQLHYSCPMRRWRLFYNGYLRETDENGSERTIYVKFALLWIASSDIYDFSEDIDKTLLVKWLASAKWEGFQPPLTKLREALNAYGQSGVIQGTINVGNELSDYEIYLFGQRVRDLGSNLSFQNMEFHHFLGYTEKNGMLVHLGELYTPNNVNNLSFGYVVRTNTSLKGLTSLSVKLDDQLFPVTGKRIKASFNAEILYDLSGVLRGHIKQETTDRSIWSDTLYQTSFELNGKKGHGVYLRRKLSGLTYINTSNKPVLKIPSVIPRTVTFLDIECQIPEITGGKGSSLGKLTHLSKELQTFIVPEGIVVTTSSYEEILTEDILTKIKMLEDVLYGNVEGDVKDSCQRVQTAITKSEFPSLVKLSIEKDMMKVFGKAFTERFAVRSSATGEDTEQMSAAGQMDTFLGVSGLDEIIRAVKKCWASQFSYVAVQYKRRYGQCINSPMAVVIQRMVACDTAGVLFTCDPLTGNPTVITITANYGLGESVVSGSEEPDTIILERDINDQLNVKNTDIGAKSNKIIMKEDGGTSEENIPENQKNMCCISKEMALRLGHLAIKIEKYYKSARDIEWGFHNNNLYIFQSRPVTSGANETIYEIDHEFDGPLRVEDDYFSTSNVGEVLPGALSPLGYQVFFRSFTHVTKTDKQTAFQPEVRAKYYSYGWTLFYNHSIFNIADIFHNMDGDNFDNGTKATLIAFFGRIPDDKDLFAAVKERYGGSVRETSWKSTYLFIKNLIFSRRQLESTLKAYEEHRIPVEKCESSRKMFDLLIRRMTDFSDVFMTHMICTEMSSIWNMLILSGLSEANGCFDDNVYRDFANLLRTCSEVESADVPAAMQSLAFHISKAVNPKEFKSKTAEEALRWLQNSSSSAGQKFRQFIEKHGHRCLKEFDMHSTTWGSNPIPLVKLLQNLSGSVKTENSDNKTANQNEPELQVKLGFKSKLKLKFLLPLSRTAVQDRERSKSLLVKVVDSFRKGYNVLAKRMVSEGLIPETDLIFFLTIEELRDLLETRSPTILARASQRQRRHPTLEKYRFAEIIKGQPRPMNETEEPIIHTGDNFSMKGIPVSQGVARGYVRKAIRLEEAAHLQPGEILLTYSTDIGWTPYFPTLAGVVTELGGLISHGAVVSREFGIPCIAGLHEATRHFQTGDYVLLDGNKGILQKIPPPAVDSS